MSPVLKFRHLSPPQRQSVKKVLFFRKGTAMNTETWMRHSKTGLPDMSDSKMSTILNLVTGSSGCAQPLEFALTSNEFKSGLSTLIIRGVPSNLRLLLDVLVFLCKRRFITVITPKTLVHQLKYHQIWAKTQAKSMINTQMSLWSVALASCHPNAWILIHEYEGVQ